MKDDLHLGFAVGLVLGFFLGIAGTLILSAVGRIA